MTSDRSRAVVDIDDLVVEFVDVAPAPRIVDEHSLATILLAGRLSSWGVRPLRASEYWRLLERLGAGAGGATPGSSGAGPGLILGQSEQELVSRHGLAEDLAARVSALAARAAVLAFELDGLEQSGIRTITVFDEHYPQLWLSRLGRKAPPLLHGAGALELLDTPGLGVVGSRDMSREGGEAAKDVARLAARRGLPLVSGGARGVDQLAMDAAFEAGGSVVGILGESLSRKLQRPDVGRAVHEGSTVMCTPYSPDAPFRAGNAMGRNKLIYAQAELTVVIASDDGAGGTWSGATDALKHGYGPVAVWRGDGEGPGNGPLQHQGAMPVSSLEDIESLLDGERVPLPQAPPAPRASAPGQQSLFAR
jgi:predicted Rossmann fold nucleotide-binding protein DprA/Smf involved in DNA uptake